MMTEKLCQGCGSRLTREERLTYGWACEHCEQQWQKQQEEYDRQLQKGDR